jgi:hypothetical protein
MSPDLIGGVALVIPALRCALADEQLGLIETDQYMVDKSPWMRRTDWLREFAGKDMNVIVGKSKKPTQDEAALRVVWASVTRLMNHCVEGVRDCTERNWGLIGF